MEIASSSALAVLRMDPVVKVSKWGQFVKYQRLMAIELFSHEWYLEKYQTPARPKMRIFGYDLKNWNPFISSLLSKLSPG
jgi:hypothetical protein